MGIDPSLSLRAGERGAGCQHPTPAPVKVREPPHPLDIVGRAWGKGCCPPLCHSPARHACFPPSHLGSHEGRTLRLVPGHMSQKKG